MKADPRLRVPPDVKCPKCGSDDIEVSTRTWGHKIQLYCNTCSKDSIIEKPEPTEPTGAA